VLPQAQLVAGWTEDGFEEGTSEAGGCEKHVVELEPLLPNALVVC